MWPAWDPRLLTSSMRASPSGRRLVTCRERPDPVQARRFSTMIRDPLGGRRPDLGLKQVPSLCRGLLPFVLEKAAAKVQVRHFSITTRGQRGGVVATLVRRQVPSQSRNQHHFAQEMELPQLRLHRFLITTLVQLVGLRATLVRMWVLGLHLNPPRSVREKALPKVCLEAARHSKTGLLASLRLVRAT